MASRFPQKGLVWVRPVDDRFGDHQNSVLPWIGRVQYTPTIVGVNVTCHQCATSVR